MNWIARGLEWVLQLGLRRRRPRTTPLFAPDQVRRILVVRKDNIGDVLCTTPVLRALRRAFPTAHVAILVAEHCRAAVARNPDLDEVLTYTTAKHRAGSLGLAALWDLARVIRGLRARAFDLAVAMGRPCSRSSAWLAYVSGARWRLGYSTPALQPFPFFVNLGCDPGAMTSHEVDGCLELLASIGIPAAGRHLALIRMRGRRRPFAGASPRWGLRRGPAWPLFTSVPGARTIAGRSHPLPTPSMSLSERLGLSILLSWAPGDASNPLFPGDDGRAVEMAARTRRRPILLPTPTPEELIAAVSLSDFVLSPDGGVMHIAAALGIPQVALFGGTGPHLWAPVSGRSLPLRRGVRADQIPVEDVVEACLAVMSRWGQGQPACSTGSRTSASKGCSRLARGGRPRSR